MRRALGTTTTSYATHGDTSDVDEVVLIGSPGAGPADHASDLGPGADHVYVGRDSRDFVAVLGDEGWVGKFGIGLGTDPSSEDFDANRFEAEDVDRSWHRNTREIAKQVPAAEVAQHCYFLRVELPRLQGDRSNSSRRR